LGHYWPLAKPSPVLQGVRQINYHYLHPQLTELPLITYYFCFWVSHQTPVGGPMLRFDWLVCVWGVSCNQGSVTITCLHFVHLYCCSHRCVAAFRRFTLHLSFLLMLKMFYRAAGVWFIIIYINKSVKWDHMYLLVGLCFSRVDVVQLNSWTTVSDPSRP